MIRRILLYMIFTCTFFESSMAQEHLHYLIRKPTVVHEKAPLLLLLHGIGSNEEDLFSFAEQLPAHFWIVSARAPYAIGDEAYAWYEISSTGGKTVIQTQMEEKSRKAILDLIAYLKTKYPIDEQQIYLCGFSQGAIMSYSIGLTQPDKIKGIAVMSGRLLEEIKPQIVKSDKLRSLRVFQSHGTRDQVLGIEHAHEAARYLRSLGIVPRCKEYVAGHTINSEMLQDLVRWLNEY